MVVANVPSINPVATINDPIGIEYCGPNLPIIRPTNGDTTTDMMKPIEKMAAVSPRAQPNSANIGGYSKENDVLAFTPTAIVTKAMPTTTQP